MGGHGYVGWRSGIAQDAIGRHFIARFSPVFLLAVMPTAIVTYVFAERYRPDGQKVAGAVVASTLFTFALLPALIWLTYWIAGVNVS